jgi:ribosomal protein S18 acetylase RimI-like enzyme
MPECLRVVRINLPDFTSKPRKQDDRSILQYITMATTPKESRSMSITSISISHLPTVTVSSTPEYARRLIGHCARSFSTNPAITSIVAEVNDIKQPPFAPLTHAQLLKHFESGSILPSAENGALIAEAEDWAAAALWEPPGFTDGGLAAPEYRNPRPVLKDFISKADAARAKHLSPEYQQKHWHLSFLARDPSKKGEGAVSAVIRPFLERAKEDGVPAWLESVGLHAAEVYEHYGFKVCEKMIVGRGRVRADGWPEEDGEGYAVWAMIFDEHLRV